MQPSMYPLVSSLLTYQETFVSGWRKPIQLLNNLLDAQIFSDYVMYQHDHEVRIAGNVLADVWVTSQTVSSRWQEQQQSEPVHDPLKQVESKLADLPIEHWNAYGYISFDIAGFYYPYTKAIEQPLLYFLVPETELHITSKGIRVRSIKSLAPVEDVLFTDLALPTYEATLLDLNDADHSHYQRQVSTLIEAIRIGQLHKAILSRSIKAKGQLDVIGTYALGNKNNISARSYCLQLGDIKAVGFSPEILMNVNSNGFVVTNPLAGTRPRSDHLTEDTRLKHELFSDAKEVKEHALSILFAQREMSSVCFPETVQIYDFMQVKQYRCVQHLSSRVGGQLQTGKNLWDALKVLFPGITVSGIDKHSALEWIDHLETEPRGVYAGGIGWVNSNGMADLAIAIRSVYQYGSYICLNAGAGIIAESIPQNEYVESVNKMNTMLTNLVLKS